MISYKTSIRIKVKKKSSLIKNNLKRIINLNQLLYYNNKKIYKTINIHHKSEIKNNFNSIQAILKIYLMIIASKVSNPSILRDKNQHQINKS